MRILLTGSSGFLGRYIYDHFEDSSDILTLSRSNAKILSDLSIESPQLPSIDLVIHCAGKAHSIPRTKAEKKEFYDVNVNGTQNLLDSLEKTSKLPSYFIYISSVSVYGLENENNVHEQAELLAKDPYGLSKVAAEKLIEKWCKDKEVVCSILRLPLLVGENPPGNLGAIIKAIDKGLYFNIAGGKARKSMILASDVAKFIPLVAPIGGIYNLTDDSHPNFDELSLAISNRGKSYFSIPYSLAYAISKIGDLLGDKAPLNSLKLKKITSSLTFENYKAKSIFGWKPQSVLDYIKDGKIKVL